MRDDLFINAEVPAGMLLIGPIAETDELVVKINNFAARTVVGRKDDRLRGEVQILLTTIGELNEVLDCRTSKTVEGLVVIADHAEVFGAFGELEEDLFLDGVGVLVLIDDDVFEDG